MQERIRWTEEEITTIVEGAAKYMFDNRHVAPTSIPTAVRYAQQALPAERRRLITGMHALSRVEERIERRLDELKGIGEQAPAVEAEPPKPILAEASLEQLLNTMLPKFVDMVADRVVEKLSAKGLAVPNNILRQYMPGGAPEHHHAHAHAPKKPEPKKPVFMVVGLKNDQQHILERKFSKEVTFKFYGKSLPKNIGSATCDYAIGMVGFLSHPVDGQLVENFQGRYFRLSNGMTQLESKIHELCKRYENTH